MHLPMNILNTTSAGALAICAGLAFSATNADALTVTFTSSGGDVVSVTDGGTGDLNTAPDAIGGFSTFVGGFTVNSFNAAAFDGSGTSILQTTSLSFSGGNAGETLTVSTFKAGFLEGANFPDDSLIDYSIGGSSLRSTLSGSATVTPATTAPVFSGLLSFDPQTDGTGAFSANADQFAVIDSPFDMETTMVVGRQSGRGGTTAEHSVTASAAVVPLPAAGLLLLSAFGGFAVLRNRRKAA